MARTVASSPLSNMTTSVLDLAFIMVICLLTLSGILSLQRRVQGELGSLEPLEILQEHVSDLEHYRDELEDRLKKIQQDAAGHRAREAALDQHIDRSSKEQERLAALIESLTKEKARLAKEIKVLELKEGELRRINEEQADRTRRIKELEDTLRHLIQTYDRLQAQIALVEDQVDDVSKKGGVPWVRSAKGDRLIILLSRATVYPATDKHFTKLPFDEWTLWLPQGTGLSLEMALERSSDFMRAVSMMAQQRQEWVLFLVNDDSYATFRALRQHLETQGIRVGWEPIGDQRSFTMSKRGRQSGPHE